MSGLRRRPGFAALSGVAAVATLAAVAAVAAATAGLATVVQDGAEGPAVTARAAARPAARPRTAARACIGAACDAPSGNGPPTRQTAADDSPSADEALALWRRFALNALLSPLLEREGPLRWSEPTLVQPCAETADVTVDGRRPQPGEALPDRPFELRWQLAGCRPLGPDSFALHGAVTMRVQPTSDALRASVRPERLELEQHGLRRPAPHAFEATLSLAATPRRP